MGQKNFTSYRTNPYTKVKRDGPDDHLNTKIITHIQTQNKGKPIEEWTKSFEMIIMGRSLQIPILYHSVVSFQHLIWNMDVTDPNFIWEDVDLQEYFKWVYNLGYCDEESDNKQPRRKFPMFELLNVIKPSKMVLMPLSVLYFPEDPSRYMQRYMFYGLDIMMYGSLDVKFSKYNLGRVDPWKCEKFHLNISTDYGNESESWYSIVKVSSEISLRCWKSQNLYTQYDTAPDEVIETEMYRMGYDLSGCKFENIRDHAHQDFQFMKYSDQISISTRERKCFFLHDILVLDCHPFSHLSGDTKTIFLPKSNYVYTLPENGKFEYYDGVDSEGDGIHWRNFGLSVPLDKPNYSRWLQWNFDTCAAFAKTETMRSLSFRSKYKYLEVEEYRNNFVKKNGFNFFFKMIGIMNWTERSFLNSPFKRKRDDESNFVYEDDELEPYIYRFTLDETFEMDDLRTGDQIILIDIKTRTFYQNGEVLDIKWKYNDVLCGIRSLYEKRMMIDVRFSFK